MEDADRIVLAIATASVVVASLVALLWANTRQLKAHEIALQALASRHPELHVEWVTEAGTLFPKRYPRLIGQFLGVLITVRHTTRPNVGREASYSHTLFAASLDGGSEPMPTGLSIFPRTAFATIGERIGSGNVDVRDDLFRKAFVVRAATGARVVEWLDSRRRAALLQASSQCAYVAVSEQLGVCVYLRGVALPPDQLHHGLALTNGLAKVLAETAPTHS